MPRNFTRKSVNPFAYGPGSTDILVTFEDADTLKLKNWPVENAGTLQAQYRQLDTDASAAHEKFRAAFAGTEAATTEAKLKSAVAQRDKLLDAIAEKRARLDADAFALAEKAIKNAT